jgi:uncharacterized protein YjeT (DUF2065 family)
MADLITALGLAMVIEGALYALFPDAMRRMMAIVLGQPQNQIRGAGLFAVALGVLIVWLVRG